MNATKQKAIKAKEQGYIYMASVVKSIFNTTYYHIVSIDDVIKAGKWIPADVVQFPSGARGRTGIASNKIDWSVTIRK